MARARPRTACRPAPRSSRERSAAACARRRRTSSAPRSTAHSAPGQRGRADAEHRRQRQLDAVGQHRVADPEPRHRVRLRERAHVDHARVVDERVLAVGQEARRAPRRGSASRAPASAAHLRERHDRARSGPRAASARSCGRRVERLDRDGHGRRARLGHELRQRPPAGPGDGDLAASPRPRAAPRAAARPRRGRRRPAPGRRRATRRSRRAAAPASGYALTARRSANVAALTISGCGGRCQAAPERSSGGCWASSRRRSSSRRSRSSRETSSGESSSNWR